MGLQLENTPRKMEGTQLICVYIYSQYTSTHKCTTQWIQPIQRCLIQYAYTKVFNTQYVPKEKVQTTNLNNTSSWPAQGKATRTTQPEEGKGKVMSNAITQ